MKLDGISLPIDPYDIKLLFVTYWEYKQSICSKNSLNYEDVKYFSNGFTVYKKWKC